MIGYCPHCDKELTLDEPICRACARFRPLAWMHRLLRWVATRRGGGR